MSVEKMRHSVSQVQEGAVPGSPQDPGPAGERLITQSHWHLLSGSRKRGGLGQQMSWQGQLSVLPAQAPAFYSRAVVDSHTASLTD